jgi:MFS transporter, FSR family, fosmidomycin resistance protein
MISRDNRVNLLIGTGHCLSHFYSLCLAPLFIVWQHEFDVSFAELGLPIVLMNVMSACLQTPYGFLVDRYGARRFLIGGTLLMSLAIAAMAFATSYWEIVVLSTLSGIGNAVFHPADYSILAGSISKEKMGRSFALHSFTGNLGFATAPPVVAAMMLFTSWRGTLLTLGLLGIPIAAAVMWQSGILKDQSKLGEKKQPMSWRQLLLERTMVLFFMFYLLGAMAGSGVQAWLITVLHDAKGIPITLASMALTSYMVGSAGGVLICGWVVDKLPRHLPIMVAGLTSFSALSTFLIGVTPVTGTIAIAMMFFSGAALGASRTPRDIMLKDAAPPGQIGKVFGFVSASLPLGGALTPVPFGYFIDHGHAEWVLISAAILLGGSLLCMGSARAAHAKRDTAAAAAE